MDTAAHPENYYELLDLRPNADAEEIKKAYRRQALKWHPDKQDAVNRTYAEDRFKLISEAYQVLNDPQKRAAYDQYGKDGPCRAANESHDVGNLFRGFGGPGMRVVITRTGPDGTTFTTTSSGESAGFDAFDHPFFHRGTRRDPFDLFRDMFASEGIFPGTSNRFFGHDDRDPELMQAMRLSRETDAREREQRIRNMQPDMDDNAALQAALEASMSEQ